MSNSLAGRGKLPCFVHASVKGDDRGYKGLGRLKPNHEVTVS